MKFIKKGGFQFMVIGRLCPCGKITNEEIPVDKPISESSKSTYEKCLVTTCGNCGRAL